MACAAPAHIRCGVTGVIPAGMGFTLGMAVSLGNFGATPLVERRVAESTSRPKMQQIAGPLPGNACQNSSIPRPSDHREGAPDENRRTVPSHPCSVAAAGL